MNTLSINKIGALALIVGPVLALASFLIEPGGILIDPADTTDTLGSITAYVSNPVISRISALMVPLGLLAMLYGLSSIQQAIHDESIGDALSRFGILCMTLATFGWVFVRGLILILTNTEIGADADTDVALPDTYDVMIGITRISGLAAALGFLSFSLGLSTRDPLGFHKIAALVIAAISILSLASLIVGIFAPSQLENMVSIARLCYFPWVIWSAILGIGFIRRGNFPEPPATPRSE